MFNSVRLHCTLCHTLLRLHELRKPDVNRHVMRSLRQTLRACLARCAMR
jgi:hypothetical protein